MRVYGDSLCKYLHWDIWSEEFIADIRTLRGATFCKLLDFIKNDDVQHDCNAIVLIVGTNNVAKDSLTVRDMRECAKLLVTVRELFPNTPIYMSAVLPRIDEYGDLVKYFNTQLAEVCVKNSVTFFDLCGSFRNSPSLYGPDGLHFTKEGYITLAQALQVFIERQLCGTVPLRHAPKTMMPPIIPVPQKSKKKKEGKIDLKQSSRIPNSAKQKPQQNVRRKKCRQSILITEVAADGKHFFRRGWKKLPPVSAAPMPLLPLHRPWQNAAAAPRCKTTVMGLPKPPTPYVQARQEGKKRKKRRKRIRKKRKRLTKVMIYFAKCCLK